MAKIAALVSGGMLDIMIADEATIRHYETLDAYLDLSELLPKELCSQLEDQFLYTTTTDGEKIPAAVSLEKSSLKDDTGIIMEPPYLAVISNTQHKEDILGAISYLFRSLERNILCLIFFLQPLSYPAFRHSRGSLVFHWITARTFC